MKIREIHSKSILSPSKIYDYVVNPYVGCQHGCTYCYARFMKRFTGHREPWGEFVDVKVNAPDLLRREITRTLDEFSLVYEAKRLNLDEQIKILFLPEPPLPFYSVFHKNEKGKMLANKYDTAIKELGFTSHHYFDLVRHEIDLLNNQNHVQRRKEY